MSGTTIALITTGCIFGGTLVGLALRSVLPEHHLTEDSKDAVKVGAGMISMMAALVLGLLVSSAKSKFDSATEAITQGGTKVILLDRVLAGYGPETREVRQMLRQGVAESIELLWPRKPLSDSAFKAFERRGAMEKLLGNIRALQPQTAGQRLAQEEGQKLCQDLLFIRWLQIEQAQTGLPLPFLIILLFWLTMLYMSFGLFAPRNATVVTMMFIGALSLATAMFLIVEMNHPMDGAIKISNGPLQKALEHIGE